jgi:Tfp pilus assembly protein PilN
VANNLNLASKPFNNRLLPWLLTVFMLFISLIGLLIVVRYTIAANRQSAAIQADINNLRTQEQALLKNAKEVKESMTPEQLQALQGAHQLVDRKRFSWTRLLSDLETALPSTVRVTRIAVRDVGLQGDQMLAELELTVFAKSSTSVTDMISDMDRTAIFRAELRAQNLQKGRGESGTEYELFVVYRPRAGYATENVAAIQEQRAVSETTR